MNQIHFRYAALDSREKRVARLEEVGGDTVMVQRQAEGVEKRAQEKLRAQGNYNKRRARD